ncbi:MAG: hypothetical protein QW727_00545 [Candidatus Pacearchaeota archaeon]
MVEKKKFYQVEIPLLKKEVELLGVKGEFNRRHIKLDLTNFLKGKALEIKFKVNENEKLISAEPKEVYLHGFYTRRMLRKGVDYVEDSFITKCKDHRIRIKPFLITRKRVSKKVRRGLREKMKEETISYVKNKTFESIILEVMNGTLQKKIQPTLKKIYPLGLCEIKFIGIEELKEHEKYEEELITKKENSDLEKIKISEEKKPKNNNKKEKNNKSEND